jgi:O-antigen ligase
VQRALLVLIIAGSLAAFGGGSERTTLVLLAAACAMLLANPRPRLAFPPEQRRLDLTLILCALAIALQLAPLPSTLQAALSPGARPLAGAATLAPTARDWLPLSIEPHATRQALATFVCAVMVFWGARAAFARGGVRFFCRSLAAIGVVASLGALIQRAASPDLIYGVFETGIAGARPFGPFVNRNHFAGWLLLAMPIATAYLVAHVRIHLGDARTLRPIAHGVARSLAAILLGAAVVMLLTLLATTSRSALVGVAVATFTGWALTRKRRAAAPRSAALLTLAAVGVSVVVIVTDPVQMAERIGASFEQRAIDRLVIWRETLPLIRDFWATGVGAGSYGAAMLVYQRTQVFMPHLGGFAHFNQAHSHYLQIAAEGGLLIGVPVAAATALFVNSAKKALDADRGEIFWVRAAAGASLAAIAAQSIWETSLRTPANALLGAALAALLVHRRLHDRS